MKSVGPSGGGRGFQRSRLGFGGVSLNGPERSVECGAICVNGGWSAEGRMR